MNLVRNTGVILLFFTFSSAQAQSSPSAQLLTLDYVRRAGDGPAGPALSFMSAGSGYVRFGLDSVRDTNYGGASEGNHTQEYGIFGFSVAPGYAITRFEFQGALSGSMFVPDASHVPGLISQYPGFATNNARVQMDIIEHGVQHFSYDRTENFAQWSDIESPEEVSYSIDGVWEDKVALETAITTSSITSPTYYQAEWGGRWYEARFFSYAGIRIDNPTLTVYYSPLPEIPEPASWMMFLGGLATAALFRKLARKRGEPCFVGSHQSSLP